MKKDILSLRVLTGFVLVLFFVILISAFSFLSIYNALDSAKQRYQSVRIIINLKTLLADTNRLQAISRGYVITGDESYLKKYSLMEDRVFFDIKKLSEIAKLYNRKTSLNKINDIGEAVEQRLEYLDKVIKTRTLLGEEEAEKIIATGRGEALTEQINTEISLFEKEETAEIEKRDICIAINGKYALAAIILGNLLAIAVIIFSITVILREIKMKNLFESMLAEKEKRMRDIINSLPQSVFEADLRGTITFLNAKALEAFEYTQKDIESGLTISELFTPGERLKIKETLQKLPEDGHFTGEEYTALKRSGNTFLVSVYSQRVYAHQNITGLRGIMVDITKRKEAEESLNKMREEFLAILVHDLQSPLAAIMGYADLLSDPDLGEMPDEKKEFVEDIQYSGRILINMIRNIVEASKIESDNMEFDFENFSLNEALSNLKHIFTPIVSKKNISLEVYAPENTRVYADCLKVERIFNNLINNAVRYTPEKGEIKITAKDAGELINIEVADTGTGIPEDGQANLFKKFSSRKDKLQKTGLGLFIVKKFLEGHGSQITFKSKPGEGTTFYFSLKKALDSPAGHNN
ncbi:MAG: ATP-binding protein [Armatimonadota bacterium]